MSVRVRAERRALDPGGPPPRFLVRTDRALCEVQVASDPILFTGAAASRRSPANFARVQAGVRGGVARAALDEGSWDALRRFPHLPYRAIAYDGTHDAPVRPVETVGDADAASAPTVYVAQAGRAPSRLTRRLSGDLAWLRLRGTRLEDENGDPVVLRGVVRDGMATTERSGVDPTGARRAVQREVAGITRDEVRELVGRWRAGVLRLPINQEWALTRPDYVASLDRIIGWAAAEGAYTLLALERLDLRRRWGTPPPGGRTGIAPLPEENTVRMWTMLAHRYRREAAVLFELYAFPHVATADDADFVGARPATDPGWVALWHAWVRRLATAIVREHGRALLLVSGWDMGRRLEGFPVALPGGTELAAVYAVDVAPSSFPSMPADAARALAAPALSARAPVFVSRWGGGDGDLAWGDALETALRARHRFRDGSWQGVVGWTAGSWGDDPSLVERASASGDVDGRAETWRTFVMDGADHRPTAFGELIRGALGTAAYATSSDFDRTRPFGRRSRLRVRASVARVGDLFALHGHDLPAGTVAEFTPSGGAGPVDVPGRAIGGFLLLVDEMPAAVPVGPATVVARLPSGARSDPVVVDVRPGPPAESFVVLPGAGKPDPFTIVLMANPWVEQDVGGAILADPIHGRRPEFGRSVGTIVQSLFGPAERVLRDHAEEIRVVTRFAPAPRSIDNALCHEIFAPYMEPVPHRVRAFLAALPLAADICFLVFGTGRRSLSSAFFTTDDAATAGLRFDLDGRAGLHRRGADTPGTVAQASPPSDDVVALHEFLHAFGERTQGTIVDLYTEDLPGPEVVNKQRRRRPGSPVPPMFKTLDGVAFRSARLRDGPQLVYPPGAMTFHGERIVPAEPNVMDNYYMATAPDRPRLDRLTSRFVRDRLEWKLGR